jgi:hypothetical protein
MKCYYNLSPLKHFEMHTLKFYLVFFICLLATTFAAAQRTRIQKQKAATDTSSDVPKTKTEKMLSDAGNYTQMAGDVKSKLKNLFPSKAGDTIYFVIPNITYTDPNLKIFKQKLSAVKNTKDLTSGYKNNTAVVKILFKGGDASNLYDNLDDGLKEMFTPEDIEGNRAILNYNSGDSKDAAKPMTATKVN